MPAKLPYPLAMLQAGRSHDPFTVLGRIAPMTNGRPRLSAARRDRRAGDRRGDVPDPQHGHLRGDTDPGRRQTPCLATISLTWLEKGDGRTTRRSRRTVLRRCCPISTCTCSVRAVITMSTDCSGPMRSRSMVSAAVVRGLGTGRDARQRGRRLQRLERPAAPDAQPRRFRGLGTVRPGLAPGDLYKFEFIGPLGNLLIKADPYGQAMTLRPDTASRVPAPSTHQWQRWRVDGGARDLAVDACTDECLRGAPGFVAPQPDR
jgi:1,4-alpha-glucan branching enzyme